MASYSQLQTSHTAIGAHPSHHLSLDLQRVQVLPARRGWPSSGRVGARRGRKRTRPVVQRAAKATCTKLRDRHVGRARPKPKARGKLPLKTSATASPRRATPHTASPVKAPTRKARPTAKARNEGGMNLKAQLQVKYHLMLSFPVHLLRRRREGSLTTEVSRLFCCETYLLR